MRLRFIILFLLYTPFAYGQFGWLDEVDKANDIVSRIYSVQKAPKMDLHSVINAKIEELLYLEDNFVYHNELKNGLFQIDVNKLRFNLIIYSDNSTSNKRVRDILNFNIQTNGEYISATLENESRYINFEKMFAEYKESFTQRAIVNFVMKSNLLVDKQVLNNYGPGISGSIINRTVTNQKLRDVNNNPISLYGDIFAGTIIPYDGGLRAKIFTIDPLWHRLTYFDRDKVNLTFPGPLAFSHPQGFFSLKIPTDITYGTKLTSSGGGVIDTVYPLYISDMGNNRIMKVDYRIRKEGNVTSYSVIDESNAIVKQGLASPQTLAFHEGTNTTSNTDDKLWFTETSGAGRVLRCINAITGADISGQTISTLDLGRGAETVTPDRLSIYRSPDGQKNMLCFVDTRKNALIFIKLNTDGTFTNTPANIFGYLNFDYQKLKSVCLASENTGLGGTTVWAVSDGGIGGCASGDNCGYVHTLKVNYVNNTPVKVDYLASYWGGVGSSQSFQTIQNVHVQNGYLDMMTIEKWNDSFGIRRLKPGIDILSENVETQYCISSGMNINVKLTNPARIRIQAYFKHEDSLYRPIGFSYINGISGYSTSTNTVTGSLTSGTNNIRVIVPLSYSLVEGDASENSHKVNFKVSIIPQDESNYDSNPIKISRDIVRALSACGSGGGCPYIYVYDGTQFKQDNNILHRSEFPANIGNDIVDKYMLNVPPIMNSSDSTFSLQFNELNNDYSYFNHIQLFALDHPIGSKVGITENNDVVLYFPGVINSPISADINGDDVTDELQYDSTEGGVKGSEGDTLTSEFPNEKQGDFRKQMLTTLLNAYKGYLHARGQMYKEMDHSSAVVDSIAVILDPEDPDRIIPVPVVKSDAGTVNAYDTESDYSSGPITFARRQNKAVVIIPVGAGVNIDSAQVDFNNDTEISYFGTTPIYYEGYVEHEYPMVFAQNSTLGECIDEISTNDSKYGEMDSTSSITMKFKNDLSPVQTGWVRDYMIKINGRYVNVGQDSPANMPKEQTAILPKEFKLSQNYPNPFNPVTRIKFELPKQSLVSLKVYDMAGREVASLVNEELKAGYYESQFDGNRFASGVYFYRIIANDFIQTKKMVLIK